MSLLLVEKLQHTAMPVNQLCPVLAARRAGLYAARKRNQVQPAVCQNQRAPEGRVCDQRRSLWQPLLGARR